MQVGQRMYQMQHKNLHAQDGRVLVVVSVQCRHRFFWALPADDGRVGPLELCDPCSDDHPEEELQAKFRQVLVLQEDYSTSQVSCCGLFVCSFD
jgi:hypothetical protein